MEIEPKPVPKKCEIKIECSEEDKNAKCKVTLSGDCEGLKDLKIN